MVAALPIPHHLMLNDFNKKEILVTENIAFFFSLPYCHLACHTGIEGLTASASPLPFRLLRMVLASWSVPLPFRAASSARAFAASARAKSWSAV